MARIRFARGRDTVHRERNEEGHCPARARRVLCSPSRVVAQQAGADQPPRFRASVEVTSIDVAVVDGQGKPAAEPRRRPTSPSASTASRARVVSAEWVPLATSAPDAKPLTRVPEGYSSNENATGGRLIAIAVDEPHIRPGGTAAVLAAASAFIDRLSPSDRVAAVSLGLGGAGDAVHRRSRAIKEAIGRMAGQRETIRPRRSHGHADRSVRDRRRKSPRRGSGRSRASARACGPPPRRSSSAARKSRCEAVADGRAAEALERDDDPVAARSARRAARARWAEDADPDVGRLQRAPTSG